ncbi:LamG-like jellyroll fold domain-containing protein [Roseateles sp. DC23W]|uniref:LamG-like jellyroll fold domain-containing protein n=1 Tax=Pelomonas dachongensis TaxID=3299029 RepID=A0ABW7EX07_9BURK
MRSLITALALSTAALAQAASPTHVYLMNDGTDLFGGSSLTTFGGNFTTSAGRYSFGANQGFSLESAVNANVYTLDFAVSLDAVSGYRRLVDFKNLTVDAGLYNLNTGLNFYPVTTGPSGAFAAGQEVRVTLTRDAAGLLTGYVDGTQQFQIDDAAQRATFSSGNAIAYFFRDDTAVSGEVSAGSIDYLRIYDSALSAVEVASLASPVPEPATGLMAAAGLGLFALLRRRRA